MIRHLFIRNKQTILYGCSLAVLLWLLKWLELRFVVFDHALEVYVGALAIIFTTLGGWLALKLARPRVETVIVEKTIYLDQPPGPSRPESPFSPNEGALARLGVSSRELEVLQLMAEGLSNQEIAGRLFLSLNTIKSHSARIFEKLEVRRRTQAVDKAKKLNIIP